jgi:hypothetical protein
LQTRCVLAMERRWHWHYEFISDWHVSNATAQGTKTFLLRWRGRVEAGTGRVLRLPYQVANQGKPSNGKSKKETAGRPHPHVGSLGQASCTNTSCLQTSHIHPHIPFTCSPDDCGTARTDYACAFTASHRLSSMFAFTLLAL